MDQLRWSFASGERLAEAATIIEGGHYPVRASGDANTVAVRNITLHTPFQGALRLFGAHTEVTGNYVSGVIGRPLAIGRTIAEAVVVGFAGRVLIEDEWVEAPGLGVAGRELSLRPSAAREHVAQTCGTD